MTDTSTSTSTGRVLATVEDGVAHLVLSNPARYNAMSLGMWQSLAELTREADANPAVRVIVLQGDGDTSFVSGADISEFATVRDNPAQVAHYADTVRRAQEGLSACGKPVIALIRGICMGGGLGLALACDLRYCADDARFRMPAARLGLGYDLQGTRRMVDILGAARASELFFTARTFDGREAARIGFVHQSYAPDALAAAVRETTTAIAGNAPLTLRSAKLSVRHLLGDEAVSEATVAEAVAACFESQDYREGQQAFREKRPPRFTGR